LNLTARGKVVVTGGSGNLGQQVVRDLLGGGYEVLSLDRVAPTAPACPTWLADLTRPGDLYQALRGALGVVHLAAYQAPNLAPDTETFGNNVRSTYNLLKAATDLSVPRVVLASSIAAYGFLYAPRLEAPEYLPLDEAHPTRPQDPYGLAKVVGETVADAFARLAPLTAVSLRLAGVHFDTSYRSFSERWRRPEVRARGFWSYVDVRDASLALRLALEEPLQAGHHVLNVAAPISAMPEPTEELVERYLPGFAAVRADSRAQPHWSGINSTRAELLLGFRAQHLWTSYLTPEGNLRTR
jgi:nucleoside-diphosphate-sugar epimerase